MHDQSSGFTIVMGGVDRSADFRRESRSGRRVTAALLVVIAVLMIVTGWLASAVMSRQVLAATPVIDTAPHHAYLQPADLNTPPLPESYRHPY